MTKKLLAKYHQIEIVDAVNGIIRAIIRELEQETLGNRRIFRYAKCRFKRAVCIGGRASPSSLCSPTTYGLSTLRFYSLRSLKAMLLALKKRDFYLLALLLFAFTTSPCDEPVSSSWCNSVELASSSVVCFNSF